MSHPEPHNRLALRLDPAGPQHYLDGRRVGNGDPIEVRGSVGWVRGLYRWSGRVEFWPRLEPDPRERLEVPALSVLRRFSADTPCRWPS